MMKKLLVLVVFVSCVSIVSAQTTAVTATVTDSDSQTWNNGKWSLAFTPNPSFPNINSYFINGTPLDPAVVTQNGVANGSGSLSFTAYQNGVITPAGSTWTLTMCPNAVTACGIYNFSTNQLSSVDISAGVSSIVRAPRFIAISGTYGYLDAEATIQLVPGNTYFNVTSGVQRTWNGTIWTTSGGGGTSCPSDAVNITCPGTITSNAVVSGSVMAGSVNKVLDLQGKFGASGSNQIMTCTTTAGSANLTSCSGGDFKVGQWLFIPSAGILPPTATTPAMPTVTCTSGNGGSCTGSTVYSYKIVGVEGAGNGPMTAASVSGTVTQAVQTKAYAAAVPWVNTTISWSSQTGVTVWLIYKSINGGPYNYYAQQYSVTSFTDNGTVASTEYNCVDDGSPCSAPSSAVPNDVYAQITAINGSTYTIDTAGSLQGSYRGGFGPGGLTIYPFIPSQSGVFTIQHDDTPAFTAAYKYLSLLTGNPIQGRAKLHIPSGIYNTHGETIANTVLFVNGFYNVDIEGDGKYTTYIKETLDRTGVLQQFLVAGCFNGPVVCLHYYAGENVTTGANVKALVDPAQVGSVQVQLSTPSDASLFPVGSWATIFFNNLPFPCGRSIDLEQIISSDSSTGLLGLSYPLARNYSATQPFPWNQALCASAGPVIAPVPGGPVVYSTTFSGFHFRGDVIFANYNTVDQLSFENMWIQDSITEDSGTSRHVTYKNNIIEDNGGLTNDLGSILTSAFGDTDKSAIGNYYTSPHYSATAEQQCVESSANITFDSNTMIYSNVGQGKIHLGAPINVATLCYNFHFTNNTLKVYNSDMDYILRLDGAKVAPVIKNNTFIIDSISNTAPASALQATFSVGPDTFFSDNIWQILSGTSAGFLITPNTVVQSGYSIDNKNNVSGAVNLFNDFGSSNVIQMTAVGNLTSINLNNIRIAGYSFTLSITQDATGGRLLPSTCGNSQWITGGNGIDCPNGSPVLNPVANSTTILSFYDDGTIIHLLSSNFQSGVGITSVQITTGVSAIAANTCTSNTATSMPGLLATSSIIPPAPTSSTVGVTGWGSSGGLSFTYFPTANTFNWSVCNTTGLSITPGSSLTWNVGAR